MQRGKLYLAAALAALMMFQPLAYAEEDLETQKARYDEEAAEALRKSSEMQTRINTISEEKRLLDMEVEEAVADYKEKKAELDETEDRIKENQEQLEKTEKDYKKKNKILGSRVRDIYIHGQISYLDVLFGAKDFSDLMTRMDLLKRVIKQDYDLVQIVLQEKNEIETRRTQLEADKEAQEAQAEKAKLAKDIHLEKQRKQKELIKRMETDKAVYDRQYDELMAASKQIEEMIKRSSFHMPVSGSGAMVWPLSGPITSEFGWRTHPIFGTARFHSGLDIGGDYGDPICAAQSGVVSYAGWISGYGNTIMIDHGGGIVTLYGHNQSLAVGEGQSVAQGEVIAYCGSTGNSTGPHCHFEVREGGEPVSPWSYL